jgi:hypothetical protein
VDREKFTRLLQGYSKIQPYRSPDFTDPIVINFWFKELHKESLQELNKFISNHIKKKDHFPSLREVLTYLDPTNNADNETLAKVTSMQIYNVICRIGYARWDDAKCVIGELGVKVVERYGGWVNLCEYITNDNQSFVVHHLSEITKSILAYPSIAESIALPPTSEAIRLALNAPRTMTKVSSERVSDTKANTDLATTE